MSTLEEVVGQLRASCDEMQRANGASIEARRRLQEALKLFTAAADGSGDPRPRGLEHDMVRAGIGAGEGARWLMHGVAAIEAYIAEVAPGLAHNEPTEDLPPVAGEELLTVPPSRRRRSHLDMVVRHSEEVHDFTEYVAEQGKTAFDFTRLPPEPAPGVATVGSRPGVPVIKVAQGQDGFVDAVTAVVMSALVLFKAGEVALDRLIQRMRRR
jgi:hypothetical protein